MRFLTQQEQRFLYNMVRGNRYLEFRNLLHRNVGVDLNFVIDGTTLLHVAATTANPIEMMGLLLNYGVDVDLVDEHGVGIDVFVSELNDNVEVQRAILALLLRYQRLPEVDFLIGGAEITVLPRESFLVRVEEEMAEEELVGYGVRGGPLMPDDHDDIEDAESEVMHDQERDNVTFVEDLRLPPTIHSNTIIRSGMCLHSSSEGSDVA